MKDQILPIRPNQVGKQRLGSIPPKVIEAFNELIAENISGKSARILQVDAVERLEAKGFDRQRIYKEHLLDVEPIYREYGWIVEFDKPAFNESYKPFFLFKIP